MLDNKHCYLAEEDVSKGILNKSVAPPGEVFALTIVDRAVAIICIPK
jgi:DNA repair protein RadC